MANAPILMALHRYTYTLEVLTDEPISQYMDIGDVIHECDYGDYVLANVEFKDAELTGKEMADALCKAGSTPDFFRLDDDGNDVES